MIAPIRLTIGSLVVEGTIDLPDSTPGRLAYSVTNAANACDVSESVIRAAIEAGELRASRPCRRIVIESSELRAWLANAARPEQRRKTA